MASPQGSEQRVGWHVFFFVVRNAVQRTHGVVFG